MRFYYVAISGGNLSKPLTFTSQANDKDQPGALDIGFDITIATASDLSAAAHLEIWGIPLSQIGQSTDLKDADVVIQAGFSGGLPLEQPVQRGIIAEGQIWQSWGNWIGTQMTLEMIILPTTQATLTDPSNVTFLWHKGSKLSDNIKAVLGWAFPDYTASINISGNLVEPEDCPHAVGTLQEFAGWVVQHSKTLNTDPNYQGVLMVVSGNQIVVNDASPPGTGNATEIKFYELIGQPTWVDTQTLQFACPLRSDLNIFSTVKMPQTQVTQSAAQNTFQSQDASVFQGNFQVIKVQHKGRFRDSGALGWVTVVDALAPGAPPPQDEAAGN